VTRAGIVPLVRALLPLLFILPLAGCDNWPLYLNLPDPVPPSVQPAVMSAEEDDALGSDDVQDIGSLAIPGVLTIRGDAEACGFDLERELYPWPDHPLDTDGDGEIDLRAPQHQGWYDTAADVDLYGVRAGADAWLKVELTWDNSPVGGQNSPFRPDDAEGAWADESDLDVLILDWDGEAPIRVVSDAGFTLSHPEVTPQWLGLDAGQQVAFAVGCHHGLPSAYELTLTFQSP